MPLPFAVKIAGQCPCSAGRIVDFGAFHSRVGATLAMFTVVNSILLKPLSFRSPERLVFITQTGTTMPSVNPFVGIAPPQFLHWRDEIRSLDSLAIIQKASVNVTGFGLPETLGAARISAGFFDTLGVTPLRGRWFYRSEEKRGGPNVAVIRGCQEISRTS